MSPSVAYTAALLLSAIFAWAALAKLSDQATTARAFGVMGLPTPRLLARVVPLAEAGLALLLVAFPRTGGVAALCLLAAFSLVLRRARHRGAPCSCFGGSGQQMHTSVLLARNTGLSLAALASLWAVPQLPTFAELVSVTTLLFLGLVVLALLDLHTRIGSLWDNRMVREGGDLPAEASP